MSSASSGQKRHLRADRVFTAMTADAIPDGVVELDGSRIGAVGPASELLPDSAEVEHYPGATILPGLVDAHCHLNLAGDRRSYEEMNLDPDEMLSLISLRNLQRHLSSGVTTLRDNGGRNRVTFVVREALQRGYFEGPRLLLSGRPITHSYGHFYWCNGVADGEVAIRAAVRQLVAEGADHIKIMASGGATAGNIPYYPSYSAAEMGVAVEAAHELGRLTTAHCRSRKSMVYAVEAGLDCIEHAEYLVAGEIVEYGGGVASSGIMEYDPKVTDQVLQSDMYVSFTMQAGGYDSLLELRAKEGQGQALTDEERTRRQALEDYFEMKLGIFAHLLEDGVLPRLVISTDAGPFDIEFGNLHYGLELATLGGMTPSQAIEAATRVAAEACGIKDLVGTLEPRKEADLLVVRGDPTEDVSQIADVVAVYKGGQLVAPMGASPTSKAGVFA
jgi:imidazolonepropionase-like amidohydrolase